MIFETRYKAGEYLATSLKNKFQDFHNNIIVGILKGGLPVSYQIAKELNIPSTFVVAKKLVKDNNKFGVVTQNGTAIYNKKIIEKLGISTELVKNIEKETYEEAKHEKEKYNLFYNNFAGKTAIVVDDGIYTGFNAVAIAKDLKQMGVPKLILAIPIANSTVLSQLKTFYDEIIALESTEDRNFLLSKYYMSFYSLTSEDINELLIKLKNENLLLQ